MRGFTGACGNGALNCDLRKGCLSVTCWLAIAWRLLPLGCRCTVYIGEPCSSAIIGLALDALLPFGCGVLYKSDSLPAIYFLSAAVIYCWSGRETMAGSGDAR